jgi:uncharacterized protein
VSADTAKRPLAFEAIVERLAALDLPEVDLVVGIASGGTVPAGLVAYRLGVPLQLLSINYRDAANRPQRPRPELLAPSPGPLGRRILLVDDVAVSGATVALARELLAGHEVTTLVLKGRADIVAFPEVGTCVLWPWAGLAPVPPG